MAIRLQSAGIATTLLEKRDRPGGRAYVYKQEGFIFDAGPTVITDPSALEELFALSGRKLSDYVTLLPVNPFYRLEWEDGSTFDYVNDQAELDAQIAKFSPDDVAGYRRFLDYSKAAFEEGYKRLGHVPFLDFKSMVKAAPQLMKMGAWRSVYDVVASYIKDEHLRQAFSFHTLLVGGSPFAASSIYALIHALEREWGVWFPKGGTGALVDGMAKLFTDLGGDLWVSAPAAEILLSGGLASGVKLQSGEVIEADLVASNADVMHTYKALLGGTARGRAAARGLNGKSFSMSLFVLYFGLKTPQPQLKHHTILFGPSYKGLVSDIVGAKPLREDFSLYLHAPCATDPDMAPPGCSTHYVLSPVPNLKQDIDWAVEGPKYADRIFAALEKRAIPTCGETSSPSASSRPRISRAS